MRVHGKNAPGTDAQTYGPGGAVAVLMRNPNEDSELNAMPYGGLSHQLGLTDDGGMSTEATVKGFHFK